jgi:Rieske Fe-S protein
MGSIPVANPAPLQRPHLSRRGLLVLALPLAAVAFVVTVVAFAWPSGAGSPRWVDAGTVDALTVNEPVRNTQGRFWLVTLESGEIRAFSERSTHLGCIVPWRPDFEFGDRRGFFRDPCSGSTWNIDGTLVFGPAPRDLDRFPVRVRDGRLQVNTRQAIPGPPVGSN